MTRSEFEYEIEKMRRAQERKELEFIQDVMARATNPAEKEELSQIYNSHYKSCKERWDKFDS